ncbi:uncharacterized protein FIBRA_04322 [Fibroporia radiculosa]|uniref:Vacuolar protein sorting-associated protein 54 N-terminal domain-containing protein n=1 Tax=Fibroporia radiculosa TaxID=599839 RepID=J4IA39_9APHY|nr:uncharacterized protein FIBRA_04322 [Fibroporia radiculosa]CCM02241.1 predicted protein [Fibroporia radiculosa]
MSEGTSTPSRPGTPVADLPTFSHVRPYRFTWDPASRKQGPGSVSATTEGRGDYFAETTPFDLYGSSLSSLQPGALPAEWSSAKYGFHGACYFIDAPDTPSPRTAISTVVNSPHKRSAPPKAHSSIPSVPPAELPRVRRKDFDAYLTSVGPEWERFQKNAEQGREGSAQIPSTPLPSSNIDLPHHEHDPNTPRAPRPTPGRALPPLESVPAVFFDPNFNLSDPRTFGAVTEQLEGADTDPAALSYSLPLLEKLSHHADTIEQHLVREISLRSTSFFAALSNLQDLQTESEQCLDRIGRLRGLLRDVDETGARRGLEIVRRECRLRNLDAVREGVRVVGGVVEMTGVAKSLVAAGQWGEALDVIEELDRLWDADVSSEGKVQVPASPAPSGKSRDTPREPLPTVPESPPDSPKAPSANGIQRPPLNVPLSSLNAFAALPVHLRELTMEITSALTSEFVNALRLDLVERIDAPQGAPEMVIQESPDTSLKDRLRPLLQCLARTRGVREASVSWREVVMVEVRNTLRRRIPGLDVDDEKSGGGGELRSMAHAAFMDVARRMYQSLLRCIEGLQRQNGAIISVLQSVRMPKGTVDIPGLQEELVGTLSAATELAHARASKVVAARAEQHAALDLPSFCSLFDESWKFVVESEMVCRRMIVGLRGTLISQAKGFLQTFHQAQISHSAKLVEDEQWNAAEVAPATPEPSATELSTTCVAPARVAPAVAQRCSATPIFSAALACLCELGL